MVRTTLSEGEPLRDARWTIARDMRKAIPDIDDCSLVQLVNYFDLEAIRSEWFDNQRADHRLGIRKTPANDRYYEQFAVGNYCRGETFLSPEKSMIVCIYQIEVDANRIVRVYRLTPA